MTSAIRIETLEGTRTMPEPTNDTSVSDDDWTVRGDPDKLFFIENLIKDIELIPAILDLADNSVDSARQVAMAKLQSEGGGSTDVDSAAGSADEDSPVDLPAGAFDGLEVKLTVQPGSFVIEDNCAGIEVDTARLYAFRIGRSPKFIGLPGSVGQFGVGMKRALFKLGRWFKVESRSLSERFTLEVDVDHWLEQDERDWSFRFASVERDLAPPDGDSGTRIEVKKLHATVISDFGDDLILGLIRQQLRLRHQEAIDRGLAIYLNGEVLVGLRPQLMQGPNIGAIRRIFPVDTPDGSVNVEIIAGIVRTSRAELNVNENRAENFKAGNEAGWWVFGNNRLLLVADKSTETGWGRGAAAYHPQYRLFRGYVYMSALDTSLIPWNTTKTGVDSDSVVWRKVQAEMVATLVEVQAVLNRIKSEREAELDEEIETDPSDIPYIRALESASATPLRSLPVSETMKLPALPAKKKSKPRPSPVQRLQFDVPRDQADRAMDVLGFSTLAELGRRSFDYFYKREVAER